MSKKIAVITTERKVIYFNGEISLNSLAAFQPDFGSFNDAINAVLRMLSRATLGFETLEEAKSRQKKLLNQQRSTLRENKGTMINITPISSEKKSSIDPELADMNCYAQ